MPPIVDAWFYREYFKFRNKDITFARAEKIKEDSLFKIIHIRNLTADSIRGIYIPKDLDDCMLCLNHVLPQKVIKEIDGFTSDESMSSYHLDEGMWLRNNWGLWGGSRLSVYFNNLKVFHPDDMSGDILKAYYHYRHHDNFDMEKEIKYYQDYWEKESKKK